MLHQTLIFVIWFRAITAVIVVDLKPQRRLIMGTGALPVRDVALFPKCHIINRSRSYVTLLFLCQDQRWSDSNPKQPDMNGGRQSIGACACACLCVHSHAASPPSTLPSCSPWWKQRLQPSRVGSIIIALRGNLVDPWWMFSVVGAHSFELTGQLYAQQRHIYYWNSGWTWFAH